MASQGCTTLYNEKTARLQERRVHAHHSEQGEKRTADHKSLACCLMKAVMRQVIACMRHYADGVFVCNEGTAAFRNLCDLWTDLILFLSKSVGSSS